MRTGHHSARLTRIALALGIYTVIAACQMTSTRSRVEGFAPTRPSRFADRPTVVYVQYALSTLGIDAGPVDGRSGPRTRAGIQRFAQQQGITAVGDINPVLVEKLREATRAPS